jgi:bifunctional polynucleotide phosphatase/kinase
MWKQKIGVLYYLNIDSNKKNVAAFDLDNTIIVTKSNAKFPKDKDDWKFIDPNIVSEFNTRLIDYNIVIFTNQKGLDKRLSLDSFKEKIMNIIKSFNLKISVFISYQDDFYRKPLTGMWDLMSEYVTPNLENSFYVGDAAGRKNDFSNSDINFANNIKIKFLLPEEFIQNKTIKYTSKEILNIRKWLSIKKPIIKKDPLELVLLVGFPGCGKSTFSMKHYSSYVYINQDTDKTKEKSIKKLKEAVKQKKSIIVDNTNLNYENRQEYINLVMQSLDKYHIKIIIYDIPIEVCQFMMYYRVQTTHQQPINIIAYRTMNKKYKLDHIIEEDSPDKYTVFRINKIYTTKKELEQIVLFKI